MANAAAAGQDALSPYQQVGLPHLGGVAKGVAHVNKCVCGVVAAARAILPRRAAPLL